jgi:hypothetical protein
MPKDETGSASLTQMSIKTKGIKARAERYSVPYLCNTGVHTVMRLPKDRGVMLVPVVQIRLIGP